MRKPALRERVLATLKSATERMYAEDSLTRQERQALLVAMEWIEYSYWHMAAKKKVGVASIRARGR